MKKKSCGTCGRGFENESDYLAGTTRWRRCSDGHLWFNCGCGSTLLLKNEPGFNPWKRHMSDSASQLFSSIDEKRIPRISCHTSKLIMVIRERDSTAKQIADALKDHPVLAADIMSFAKRRRGGEKISSVEMAIASLGLDAVSDIVALSSFRTARFKTQRYSSVEHWNSAIHDGQIAESLVFNLKGNIIHAVEPDYAFVAGSLANIGKAVEACMFPEIADRIWSQVSSSSSVQSWREVEIELGTFDHSILGELTAALWGFSSEILEAISSHHSIGSVSGLLNFRALAFVAAFAVQVGHAVRGEWSQRDHETIEACERFFGLKSCDTRSLIAIVPPFVPVFVA